MSRQRGQITPRGANKFRIRYQTRDSTGALATVIDETIEGTRDEAERLLTKRLYEFDEGLRSKKDGKLLSEFLLYWNQPKNRPDAGISELRYSAIVIARYLTPTLGAKKVQDLKPFDIREALETIRATGRMSKKSDKPLSKSTIRHCFDKLKMALDLAVTDELITLNPCNKVPRPPLDKKTDKVMPKPEQVVAFLQNCQDHSDKLALYGLMAVETGFRLGECAGVRLSCVSREFKSIRCNATVVRSPKGSAVNFFLQLNPKTQHGFRTVRVSDALIAAIDAYVAGQNELRTKLGVRHLTDDDPIFLTVTGRVDDLTVISHQIARASRKAGIDGTMHTMRHAHASDLLTVQGLDLKRVQKRLGHASAQTTLNIYGHLIQEIY